MIKFILSVVVKISIQILVHQMLKNMILKQIQYQINLKCPVKEYLSAAVPLVIKFL